MLTQENFYQGLEENCNQEQGAADFPEEIEFPLYDFLHKTPIWSLSTTLKEELAKYKRNVIQPAVTPLWILLIERAPSYEENMERVTKHVLLFRADSSKLKFTWHSNRHWEKQQLLKYITLTKPMTLPVNFV